MQVHCLEAPTAHFLHPHAPQLRTDSHLSPQGTVPGLWLLPGKEEVGSRAVKLGPRLGTSTSKDVREKTAASSLYRGLRREEGRCLSSGKCRTGLGDHEHRAPGPGLSVGSSTVIRSYAMGCGRLLCSSCEAAVLSRHRLLRGEGAVCPHQLSPEGIPSEPSMGGLLRSAQSYLCAPWLRAPGTTSTLPCTTSSAYYPLHALPEITSST